jgi:predicted patatin/cPLA2 family phospholipase
MEHRFPLLGIENFKIRGRGQGHRWFIAYSAYMVIIFIIDKNNKIMGRLFHVSRGCIIRMMSGMHIINAALVLEGGGLRGNYTAGVMDAFLDGGIHFPYIIGVSAGVGYGCSFVSKQRGRNLEILTKYRKDPRYLSYRSLFTTGNLFGLDFIYNEIPLRLVPFDYKTFLENPSRFVAVCTDLETGEALYYEKNPELSLMEYMNILKGSSALPYISKIVEVRGRKLLDGAIVDAVPLKKAQAEGYGRSVVVLTQPAGFRKREAPHPPPRLFYGKYPRFITVLGQRVAAYNATMDFIEEEERQGRILVLRPAADMAVGRAEKSVEKLVRLYESGLSDGAKALSAIEAIKAGSSASACSV